MSSYFVTVFWPAHTNKQFPPYDIILKSHDLTVLTFRCMYRALCVIYYLAQQIQNSATYHVHTSTRTRPIYAATSPLKSKNQLDATYCFVMLMIGSACFGHFGHYYAHHQELTTIVLLTT